MSVTGNKCYLLCKHCNGSLLEGLLEVKEPNDLWEIAVKIHKDQGEGFLLTGGCDTRGVVHFSKYFDILEKIKKEFDLEMVVHTGLVSRSDAESFKRIGIKAVLVDIIGSDRAIQEVYNLPNHKVSDYDNLLALLHELDLPVVPHVLAGLEYGEIKGEYAAIDMITKHNHLGIIIIVFMPIQGTPFQDIKSPPVDDVIKIINYAKQKTSKPVILGCARPRGKYRMDLDQKAVTAGIDAIARPSITAISEAEKKELEIHASSTCCAQFTWRFAVETTEER
ncbi:MAG: radical SAM protein [Candidatus Kariarchaeaceae archaeon]